MAKGKNNNGLVLIYLIFCFLLLFGASLGMAKLSEKASNYKKKRYYAFLGVIIGFICAVAWPIYIFNFEGFEGDKFDRLFWALVPVPFNLKGIVLNYKILQQEYS